MLPQDFLDRMKTLLGDEFEDFIASYNKENYHALRINPLKSVKACYPENQKLLPVPWTTNGYYYPENLQPGKHPFHEAGVYYIQEPSAMAPAEALMVEPGDIVLDLCAAPGGKSTQIAGKLQDKGLLISNEIIPSRAKILSENIERLGIKNAIVTNEDSNHLAEVFPEFFDKIMVDAPCSGEGMFRKNSEACNEWSLENVKKCSIRQAEILDNAALMLKPGGRMVYSTCTFSTIENEDTIKHFLEKHPDFHIANITLSGGISEGFLTGTLRLWPHKLDGEGHFVTVLEKNGILADKDYIKEKSLKKKELVEYTDFEKNFLNISLDGIFTKFGNQLYVLPDITPSLKGIKVLRPGLHLGTILKNRFEPSHSLALAINKEDAKNVCNLNLEDNTIYNYINGETFEYNGDGKGWFLITICGYSIGFGKLSGGIMKNHYPKGLRKNLKTDK